MKFTNRISAIALAAALPAAASAQDAEIWHYLTAGGELDAMVALTEVANEQHPDTPIAQVTVPGGPAGLRQQVQVAVLGGDPPALYQTSLGRELLEVSLTGRLQPVTDIWNELGGDDIYPEALKAVTMFNGEVWALPVNIGIITNVYYNTAIFEEYGLEPPTTYDEWLTICETVEANGIACLGNGQGYAWSLYNFYGSLLATLGGEGFYGVAEGTLDLSSDEFKQALEHYRTHYGEHYMPNWTGGQWTAGADALAAGDVAMYHVGDWGSAYLQGLGMEPGVDFDYFPAPVGFNATVLQPDGIAMPAGISEEAQAAAENFLRAVGSAEGQVAFNSNKGSLAAMSETPTDFYDPLQARTFERMNEEGAQTFPNLLTLLPASISQDFGSAIERFADEPTEEMVEETSERLEALRQQGLSEDGFQTWH
ncbi:ABC transporter substrate-binding protein [Pseudoroseicyclus sp. H15]